MISKEEFDSLPEELREMLSLMLRHTKRKVHAEYVSVNPKKAAPIPLRYEDTLAAELSSAFLFYETVEGAAFWQYVADRLSGVIKYK